MANYSCLLSLCEFFKDGTAEEYISVNRMSVESWFDDIQKIPQRRNRQLYGYAELNVGRVRHIELRVNGHNVAYTVFDCRKGKHEIIMVNFHRIACELLYGYLQSNPKPGCLRRRMSFVVRGKKLEEICGDMK